MVVDSMYGKQLAFCEKKKVLVSFISPVVVSIALKEFQIVIVRIFCSLVSLLCVRVTAVCLS